MSEAEPVEGAAVAGTTTGDDRVAAAVPLRTAVAVGPLDVVADPAALADAVARLIAGTGPVAVDAERANGFRYSARAYLVQLYRRGSGTVLIDPIAAGDLTVVQRAIGAEEWIIHAASQDLPCLRELGLEPGTLFDTELGARLCGFDRVGLAAVAERLGGIHLRKEHGASDWSQRPIPREWLEYAALDVEVLPALRDALQAEVVAQGKERIVAEEFAYALRRAPKPPSPEPWRRLSGVHAIRDRRQLAVARALWLARDALARERDRAPGRLLPDRSIVAAAQSNVANARALAARRDFVGRASRSELSTWWEAIVAGRASDDLPALRVPSTEPPPPRFWKSKRPAADARLRAARLVVAEVAAELAMPAENLVAPDLVRRLAWDGVSGTQEAVAEAMRLREARPWQIAAISQKIAAAFVEADQQIAESAEPAS